MQRSLATVAAVCFGLAALIAGAPASALEPEGLPDQTVTAPETPPAPEGATDVAQETVPETDAPLDSESDPNDEADPGQQGADLQALPLYGWAGPGTTVIAEVYVLNAGPGVSSGHTLDFSPQFGSNRVVTADEACSPVPKGGFRCTGGELRPGEMHVHAFRIEPPTGVDVAPPFWVATVSGNEPDPVPANDSVAYEIPGSNFVALESDIKTRVDDANGDLRATAGERMEVYVHFTNGSDYTLEQVNVSITGTVSDHRVLEESVAPAEERTVRFDAIVPELDQYVTEGMEAEVTATVVGASVAASTGTLMVVGPYAIPNPTGVLGEQIGPRPQQDPLAFDPDEVWDRYEPPVRDAGEDPDSEGDAVREVPIAGLLPPASASVEAPVVPVIHRAADLESSSERAPAQPESASTTREATSASAELPGGHLDRTGAGPLGGPLAFHLLVALGVVFAHIGITRQLSRARARV